jgi:hypothetical protein
MWNSGVSGSTGPLIRRVPSLQNCSNAKQMKLELQYNTDIMNMTMTMVDISCNLRQKFPSISDTASNDRLMEIVYEVSCHSRVARWRTMIQNPLATKRNSTKKLRKLQDMFYTRSHLTCSKTDQQRQLKMCNNPQPKKCNSVHSETVYNA